MCVCETMHMLDDGCVKEKIQYISMSTAEKMLCTYDKIFEREWIGIEIVKTTDENEEEIPYSDVCGECGRSIS